MRGRQCMCTMSKHSMGYKLKKRKRQEKHALASKHVEAQRQAHKEASDRRQNIGTRTSDTNYGIEFWPNNNCEQKVLKHSLKYSAQV